MSEIKIRGPVREPVPEWTDPETGEIHDKCYIQVIIAEALGSDGSVHLHSFTAGDRLTEYPDFIAGLKVSMAGALKRAMQEKGVWIGE